MERNTLYYGDNLEVMKSLLEEHPRGFVDLIYIDPPFNSKRNYNILYEDMIQDASNGGRNTALKEAFRDTWSNVYLTDTLEEIRHSDRKLFDMLESLRSVVDRASISYLTMMGLRLLYMHRLLKETGSFYLHCDPTMSHYLKIVCDTIFNKKNFRNEIIWYYKNATMHNTTRTFVKKNQNILFYSKGENYKFHLPEANEWTDAIVRRFGKLMDENGDITYKVAREHGERSLLSRVVPAFEKRHHREPRDNDIVYHVGHPKLSCVWDDIPQIRRKNDAEHLGYPTQKPLALLERAIRASSEEGDVVADFFCGCGTTVVAAERTKRRWLGVDISHLAVSLVEAKRLLPLQAEYEVIGFPKDVASAERLAQKDIGGRFRFQDWIIEVCLTGHSQSKKSADGGFDGHVSVVVGREKAHLKYSLIEVKSGAAGIADLRAFYEVVERTQASDMGIFVCFARYATKGMRDFADQKGLVASDALFKVPKLSVITVEELLEKRYPEWLLWTIRETY